MAEKAVSLRMNSLVAMGVSYGIVGAGQLSSAFAVSLGSAVAWIANRGEEKLRRISSLAGGALLYRSVEEIEAPPGCIVLAVSDSAVQQQAELCAKHWGSLLAGCFVVHCSGALGREVLDACRSYGARTVAAHPFQTIAASAPGVLSGAAWGIEAEEEDKEFARGFAEQFGGTAFFLSEEMRTHKALYHASASAAANYLTVLVACAADLASAAGIPASLFLPPIMHVALDNALRAVESNSKLPLTGPIARADMGTLESHIRELRAHPPLLREYCLFGLAATELAVRHGSVQREAGNAITRLLYAELGDNHATP